MSNVTCVVCGTPVPRDEISTVNQYSGLPSPCCDMCVEVRDYTDKSVETVAAKSLLRRATQLADKPAEL